MKEISSEKELNEMELIKIRKRAEKLKNSIETAKNRGLIVNSHEPIEGKMYW